MAVPYIGNDDYRGWLAYLASQGDKIAQGYLDSGIGNDGKWEGGATGASNAVETSSAAPYYYQEWLGLQAGGDGGGGGGTYDQAEADRLAQEEAERQRLRGEITGYGTTADELYAKLFADLDALVNARKGELETQYGEQFGAASKQYADALPQIETSYAALGASDSTDQTYAKNDAKTGFDTTTKKIGDNKKADEAALGKYAGETRTKFQTDQDSTKRNIGRAGETTDVSALRSLRNDIETNIDTAKTTAATLGTDEGARGKLKEITADKGRYEEAINALDSIIKSSMSGAVKQAAVTAVTDAAGLSEEDKQKVQQQYGDVYAEQAAL